MRFRNTSILIPGRGERCCAKISWILKTTGGEQHNNNQQRETAADPQEREKALLSTLSRGALGVVGDTALLSGTESNYLST